MESRLKGINNIIFDLGGVILNIDYQLTIDAFIRLGVEDFHQKYSQAMQIEEFDLLETGQISYVEFRGRIKEIFDANLSDDRFDTAWNAMLLDLPKERVDFLKRISTRYRTFLLSNTNQAHYDHYSSNYQMEYGFSNLSHILEKEYYSHEIGRRKPHVSTFQFVLDDAGLEPAETLFIDDSEQHIEGAKKTGMQTWHLQTPSTILDLEKAI